MKKILFAVLALIVCVTACNKYDEIIIVNVKHAPEQITENDDVTVTATITCKDEFTAKLHYAVNEGEEQTVDMTKAQNEYTATIPAQAADAKVAYWVIASNENTTTESTTRNYQVETVIVPEPDYTNLVLNELNGGIKFIELYNKGEVDLPLVGMTLYKDESETIWTADATIIIPAGGHLLLYSAKSEEQAGYPKNLVFSSGLSSKKSVIIELFMPDGTTICDVFVRGEAPWNANLSVDVDNKSFARTPDGGEWQLVEEATPGIANPETGEEIPL